MTKKSVERLEELLDKKDETIEKLSDKVDHLERELDYPNWEWMRHSSVEEDSDLPVPRLEMRYVATGTEVNPWYNYEACYNMVHRHFQGHLMSIPLGQTRISGGNGAGPHHYEADDQWELPFRDGAHIRHDAVDLNLPAFVVIEPDGVKFSEKIIAPIRVDPSG